MAATLQIATHAIGDSQVDDYARRLATTLRSDASLVTSSQVELWFLMHHNPRLRTRTDGDRVEVLYTHQEVERLILSCHCPRPVSA